MIFSNLFHRKKNKESETGSFSQYDQSEYAKLETKNIVKELNLSDAAQAKKYVVDLCKQMIQASKDMDCLLYTSPSPRDVEESRMPSSA